MSNVIDSAVSWARQIAADPRHGYDQTNRQGPDYDCSSFVIAAFKQAGIPLKSTYTGNMRADMLQRGFADVTQRVNRNTGAGLEVGDVLLNERNHTALYIGNGRVVQASINELGNTTGGKTGDQTGREIYERGYYNYPWDCVLRYVGASGSAPTTEDKPAQGNVSSPDTGVTYSVQVPLIKHGSMGGYVRTAQRLLIAAGFSCGPDGADGEYGANTVAAATEFQRTVGLLVDGEIGGDTWAALLKG